MPSHLLVPVEPARAAGRWVMPAIRIVTVGVYGFNGESFLQRLGHADAPLLLEVRQRRSVRTPECARSRRPFSRTRSWPPRSATPTSSSWTPTCVAR
ncbi:hypothetical protein SAM23877_0561 [Streptomyces ambofaciens ATCC 23877]|uniref:Uncharacterized protein n=1 Tax=Streptomyces ambofaciens (strain ATCC 23877 / 3486 / DSM 40053 / JCM 4204 / NBRC 12836 / NRRL B-2516) TaxID=278992 RepID=A0A0K2AKK3_STRA7|nr:hypothetical protein SAM23877_0561 [Streptomyces ambofaciens ATCC 23877]